MKYIYFSVKRLCLGIIGLYTFNLILPLMNIVIPINIFTVLMSSILGIFGILTILLMKFII